ncbi:MAG: DUF6011 domain-containing protein [Propionibacteriaceae bacterium]|jgi:hypothetical protein|nr:DUF6011 domain-containing protein [Propionibacteriaceae bacterium]
MVMASRASLWKVFVDADVLAAPLTRSILLTAAEQRETPFRACWSLAVEAEADRALRGSQAKLAGVRELIGDDMLVPDATDEQMSRLADTDTGDRHVLAAAVAARARVVVSRNVHHFGRDDLTRLSVAAAHPDAFLASSLTGPVYRDVVRVMASRRGPGRGDTPEEVHRDLGALHPRLFAAMVGEFPGVDPKPSPDAPPSEVFRGNRCLVCGKTLSDPESLAVGVGPECGRKP